MFLIYKGKSLDLDLVTVINCHPDDMTVKRLRDEEELPRKVEEHMRGQNGICLTAKVDKMGVGNKMIDFCLGMSHESYLKKFKGLLSATQSHR